MRKQQICSQLLGIETAIPLLCTVLKQEHPNTCHGPPKFTIPAVACFMSLQTSIFVGNKDDVIRSIHVGGYPWNWPESEKRNVISPTIIEYQKFVGRKKIGLP